MTIAESEMMHLVLKAQGAPGVVRLTVSDMLGNPLATLTATSGRDAVSLTQGLTAGYYLIRFEAFTTDGAPLGPIEYTLKGARLSAPIGPRNADSTAAPAGSAPPPSSDAYSSSPPPSTSPSSTSPPPSSSSPSSPPPSSPPPSGTSSSSDPSTAPPPRPDGMTDEEYAYYCQYYYQYNSGSSSQSSPDPYSDPYTAS